MRKGDASRCPPGCHPSIVAAAGEVEREDELRVERDPLGEAERVLQLKHLSHLLELLCCAGHVGWHVLSIWLKRFCWKVLFWTIETRLSSMFSSSTTLRKVRSTVSNVATCAADHLDPAPATACSILWLAVLCSSFMCSRWTWLIEPLESS